MLVTSTTDTSSSSGTPSRTPSILDSPILARVERARLRLEASSSGNQQTQQNNYYQNRNSVRDDSLERSITDPKQSLLAGRIPIGAMTGPIKRGLLWQQRDRLFSRWKERYFVLTRDYLHCFKRASGSANERASDMGQFIFKVKLVDVEKVEWLNRRSYSAIGLVLGREGRVLLRSDDGLEDWFELLEECTLTSKERRHALKITQSPRSRASLAAPISHASLQANHFGLGGTYSSALDDWLMTHNGGSGGVANGTNTGRHHLFSDSVPDLSSLNNENHSGLSTNHSTPQKTSSGNSFNVSRSSHGYASQNNSFFNGLYGSPRRIFINSFKMSQAVDEEELDDGEVELRRSGSRGFCNNNAENGNDMDGGSSGGGNGGGESLYRKPRAPTDMRHSVQTDWDYIANDSGFNTPQSTTPRPSSYRDMSHNNSSHHSMETSLSSTRSPCGSFRNVIGGGGGRGVKHSKQASAVVIAASSSSSSSSRYYLPERVLKIRNEEDFSASMLKVQNFRNNNNNNANTSNNNNSSSSSSSNNNNNNSEQMSIRV